jgi:hypothetical protein
MGKTSAELQRERLSEMLTNKQAILVFGSGITVQATNAETASWAGLLESGIDHCVGFAIFRSENEKQEWAEARRADLRNPDPESYVKVAGEIELKLKELKSEREAWLKKAIGSLQVRDFRVLEAIKGLAARFKPKILTTNYDTIISEALGVNDITWGKAGDVVKILNGESPNVLHIHGLWSEADTVVLGTGSYGNLLKNKAAQALQQAFTATNSLIFIGCGDGIRDDNIGALLKWFATTLPESALRHYILLRDDEARKYSSTPWLFPISYGRDHDHLPSFLDSLTPIVDQNTMKKQATAAKALINRVAEAWTRRNLAFQGEINRPSKSVAGSWRGQQTQQTGPADEPISYPVALDLKIENSTVTGIFTFTFGPEGLPLVDESLELEGQLEHGRFLRLSYARGDDKLQFGTLLLEIAADGDTLIGNDIGYGYTTRQTLTALTRLRRSAAP